MIKITKKVVAFVMTVIILSAIIISGCSNQNKAQNDNVPVITWYVPGPQQNDINIVMRKANEILEKEIGARLNLVFIDFTVYAEKMNMYMASDSKFDLCFTGYTNSFGPAVQRGGLLELDELLKTTPKLREAVPDYYWKVATVNGKIYAVPNQQILGAPQCIIVKKEMADKYNFDVNGITKLEDVEPLLQKVRDFEKDLYPIRTKEGLPFNLNYSSKFAYGLVPGVNVVESESDVEIVSYYESDDYYDGAKKLYDWFKKGYIRNDNASVMDDTAEYNSGKYAVWVTSYKPGIEADTKAALGFDVYTAIISKPYVNVGGGRDTMIGIGKNSKNPELAIKLIEQMNTNKELYNLISFGIEGKHYKKIDDVHIRYVNNSGYAPKAAWKFGNQFNALLLEGQADDVWEETKKLNDSAYKSALIGYTADTALIRTEITQVESVIGEYSIITKGSKNPDTYYNDFKLKLKDAGNDKIVEEINRQVKEFLQSQNK